MISLKNKSKGFTIVELLIVIVIIAILATLVIVTFTGIQAKARDSQRQTDIDAVDSHVEAFYAQYGFYPTEADLASATFVSGYMKGLDPAALVSPDGKAISATAGDNTSGNPGWAYGYVASGTNCTNTTATTLSGTPEVPQDNGCTAFTLKANLEGGGDFTKSSNT